VKVAKEAGATIVNVTNNYNEQLFEMTDYAIYAPASSEALFGRSGSARLVQLSLIDCLFATIANMLPKQSTENIDKVSRITKHLHLPL
ncbi:MAG TPA: SIS domain-containing protein, partial [Psychromonas sp.]